MQKTEERLKKIESDVAAMQTNIKTMLEIIETWNNTKGFVITISIISKIVVWLGVSGAALAAIYHSIKHFGD